MYRGKSVANGGKESVHSISLSQLGKNSEVWKGQKNSLHPNSLKEEGRLIMPWQI